MQNRPEWPEYFMAIAKLVATRSTCLRRQVGAILVKDRRIIATGYNGAPKEHRHCLELGCLRDEFNLPKGSINSICRAVHAEINCICQCAKYGINMDESTLYCNTFPCSICARALVNAGIIRVVYESDYPDELGYEIFRESGINCVMLLDGVL